MNSKKRRAFEQYAQKTQLAQAKRDAEAPMRAAAEATKKHEAERIATIRAEGEKLQAAKIAEQPTVTVTIGEFEAIAKVVAAPINSRGAPMWDAHEQARRIAWLAANEAARDEENTKREAEEDRQIAAWKAKQPPMPFKHTGHTATVLGEKLLPRVAGVDPEKGRRQGKFVDRMTAAIARALDNCGMLKQQTAE